MATLRRVKPCDAHSVSRICLLTGDAGETAECLYNNPELLGLVYALPYVEIPITTFGYVVEDSNQVVGYVLGSTDTRTFEHEEAKHWWPFLRAKYPLDDSSGLTVSDTRMIRSIHFPSVSPEHCMAFSPAHLHINILPAYQRRGWGRKLIGKVMEYLCEQGCPGVWLGLDTRNKLAATFYERLGFERVPGAGEEFVGITVERWNGRDGC
jgi:ribosomal protein S18 acetylase RimI-like enzyme